MSKWLERLRKRSEPKRESAFEGFEDCVPSKVPSDEPATDKDRENLRPFEGFEGSGGGVYNDIFEVLSYPTIKDKSHTERDSGGKSEGVDSTHKTLKTFKTPPPVEKPTEPDPNPTPPDLTPCAGCYDADADRQYCYQHREPMIEASLHCFDHRLCLYCRHYTGEESDTCNITGEITPCAGTCDRFQRAATTEAPETDKGETAAPCERMPCAHHRAGHCHYRDWRGAGEKIPLSEARKACPMITDPAEPEQEPDGPEPDGPEQEQEKPVTCEHCRHRNNSCCMFHRRGIPALTGWPGACGEYEGRDNGILR